LGFSSSVSAQLLIGDGLVALFSSIINLGALVGSLLVGPMLNNRGRRKTLLISSIPSVFGWLLIAAAKGLSPPATSADPFLVFSFILGRFLSGFAAGIMNAVASVYLVEVAPPHQSGRIGSLAQFGTVAGTCFAYYCGMVFMWYETAFLVLVLSVILLAATFFLPESSAWLVKHGQMQAALKDLTWLRGDYLWLSVLVFRAGHRIRCFAKQSCPVRSLNSATASILGQSGMSESATVHCFSFVRALSSLHLEVWNSLLIKAFIVWKDIGRSMHCKIVVPFLATVLGVSLFPIESIADCESESITALQRVAMQELSELASSGSEPDNFTLQEHFFDKPLLKVHTPNLSVKTQVLHLLLPCTTIPPELSANLRIAMILMIAQQTTGINVITFYTEPLCQRMVHVSHSAECAFALGLAQLLFSLFASLFIIDRLPRRKLIVATGLLMSSSMFLFAIGQQFPNSAPISPLTSLIAFLFGYQCGWGPLAMLITLELFPSAYRGVAGAAAVAVNWGITFLVTQSFQPLVRFSGELAVFVAHAILTLFASVYLHQKLPETNPLFMRSFTSRSIDQISPFLSFLGLIGFLLGFQSGWGPLGLLVAAELTPPQHRGGVSASAVATSWIVSFVITQTFQPIVSVINGHSFIPNPSAKINEKVPNGGESGEIGELVVFLIYSILTALASIYFHYRLPETNNAFKPKSKSREEFA
uniref:MFS domain-containing protein n=1 Tax=Rodentolepis nana TaxID=102285 RepID=A0A0R3TUJ0_RODNA